MIFINSYARLHKATFNCKRELFNYNGRRKFQLGLLKFRVDVALRSCGGGSAGHFVTFIIQVAHIREFNQGQFYDR